MPQILYRPATKQDVSKIKTLTDDMLKHTGLGVATVEKITQLVVSPRTLVLLAFDKDNLVGYTCGILHENVFNDVLRVTDIGVFVLKEHRSTDIGQTLLEQLEAWAKKNNAEQLWLGQTTGEQIETIAEYYRRLGFKISGFNAVKEL
jgi:GNAT superfamily N-acetyltransferase